MAKNKIKKIVKIKEEVNDDIKFKQLVIIFILMTVVCVGLYYLTDNLIAKDQKSSETESSSEIVIDPRLLLLSELLVQKEKNYYVLVIDYKAEDYDDYASLIDGYNNDQVIKLYKSNLSDGLNKKYVAEKSNPKATKINDVKISGPTLIEVNDGKLVGYFEGAAKITPKLK